MNEQQQYQRKGKGCIRVNDRCFPKEWQETGQKRNRITMVAVEFYLAPDKVEEEKPAKASNKTKRTKKETSK